MGVEYTIKFRSNMERISTSPLSNPAALHPWLPSMPNMSKDHGADAGRFVALLSSPEPVEPGGGRERRVGYQIETCGGGRV